jgi:serine/threonine protein kinase
MKSNMVRLQSIENRDVFYEYDPETSLVDIDFYGKCYRGVCLHDKHVLIHEIKVDDDIPQYLMCHVLYVPLTRIDGSQVISIIDKIPVYKKDVNPKSQFFPSDTNQSMLRLYLIEEDFSGISLADVIRRRIPDRDILKSTAFIELKELCYTNRVAFAKRVTSDILKCVGYMHKFGICARIVDPHRVIIANDGNVKFRELHSFVDMLTNSFKGSIVPYFHIRYFPLSYCSPEIFMRDHHCNIDPRSDIYSIGLLLFFILTGHNPYVGGIMEIIDQQIKGTLSLKEIEDIHLKRVIRKATEKDPKKRYQTADEFIEVLDNVDEPSVSWFQRFFSSLIEVFHISKKIRACIMLFAVMFVSFCSQIKGQNMLRIHGKDGAIYEMPTENVDSITFCDADSLSVVEAELTGSWLWGSAEQGYYELLTFNEDKTYTGYDNYFTYGLETTTYGFYSQYGAMLTLWSNGFGYNRRFNWYITGLMANAFEVMTKMGPFTYYRILPEIIHVRVGSYVECGVGEELLFADGVKVSIEGNKLHGISEGATYVIKYNATLNITYAYKVMVD